ncbi:MAG: type II toxin-antitoxin system prevent-host-death family antitoxin [Gemmatimonadaceae bacterium]
MKSVSVSDAKNNLSAILREVRGGATILITDRGLTVARLSPPAAARGIPAAAVELAQRGRLVLPERQPTAKWLDLPRPKARGKASALRALLDERDSAR